MEIIKIFVDIKFLKICGKCTKTFPVMNYEQCSLGVCAVDVCRLASSRDLEVGRRSRQLQYSLLDRLQ